MADNEMMDMANFEEIEVPCEDGASKLDKATTIFCVTGSTIAIIGAAKKFGKWAWNSKLGRKIRRVKDDEVEESSDVE